MLQNRNKIEPKCTPQPVWGAFLCGYFVPRRFFVVVVSIHVNTNQNHQLN